MEQTCRLEAVLTYNTTFLGALRILETAAFNGKFLTNFPFI